MLFNPLATLPAELRLRIYEYALASQHPIKRQVHESALDANNKLCRVPATGDENVPAGLSLLLVDRLTYKESLPVLYEVNTFRVKRAEFCDGMSILRSVPGSITYLSPQHITHLELPDFQLGLGAMEAQKLLFKLPHMMPSMD